MKGDWRTREAFPISGVCPRDALGLALASATYEKAIWSEGACEAVAVERIATERTCFNHAAACFNTAACFNNTSAWIDVAYPSLTWGALGVLTRNASWMKVGLIDVALWAARV